ncbi:polyprenyl synthetase family protein [Desulfosporosinus nitroreducens]|uniref:Polyprenyl synthetase family protein n=1 Tax=Desulfosporosinus nitroreducens TaxID=2018668 RepID=A0ABT8QSI9_9FIRM|nr:polyprenyl synthetase family protein [Desulfosporosinus nitroreducens]MCO1603681.1 polyprenyl synthetase family protein [Desulfosporosinus nitroreducens]MDO0824301.1 polyprenyl synthetase family protein [Desulfosporosinus nitroreducens]
MNMDQVIAKEIKLLLTISGLSKGVVSIINSWLDSNFKINGRYGWAQLTLITCEGTGGTLETGLQGAVAMELYALAADILDDIQDQDNNDLPWRKVPPAQAINLATCILVLSYKALSTISNRRHFEDVSNVLNQMGLQACDGQFQEFLNDGKEKISLEEYFEIIKKKSGGLTASACKIGAILGDAEQTLVNQLGKFGLTLGLMSQIKNDFHDFLNIETKSDLVKGRKTLPFVYLLYVLNEIKAEELKRLSSLASIGPDQFGPKERGQLRELVVNEGTIHYCSVIYEMYKQRAKDILDGIPIPEKRKEKLIQLVR